MTDVGSGSPTCREPCRSAKRPAGPALSESTNPSLRIVEGFTAIPAHEGGENEGVDVLLEKPDRRVAAHDRHTARVEGVRVVVIEDVDHPTPGGSGISGIGPTQAARVAGDVPVAVERVEHQISTEGRRLEGLPSIKPLLLASFLDEADRLR